MMRSLTEKVLPMRKWRFRIQGHVIRLNGISS